MSFFDLLDLLTAQDSEPIFELEGLSLSKPTSLPGTKADTSAILVADYGKLVALVEPSQIRLFERVGNASELVQVHTMPVQPCMSVAVTHALNERVTERLESYALTAWLDA